MISDRGDEIVLRLEARIQELEAECARLNHAEQTWKSQQQDLEEELEQRTAELHRTQEQLREYVIEWERAEKSLRYQNEYLAALHKTTLALMHRLDLNGLLEDIITRAAQLTDAPHGYIYLVDRATNECEIKVGVGILKGQVGFRVTLGEGIGGKVWQSGKPLVIDSYYSWPGRSPSFQQSEIGAVIGVPLMSDEQVVGVIGLALNASTRRTFQDEDVENLTRFAQLASIALDNAHLYTAAQQEIAERRRAEHELQKAKEIAETANHTKSAFLASMSHELRTPLNAIIGYSEMLYEDILENATRSSSHPDALVDLNKIRSAARHLLAIVNDILDFSKIEAGKLNIFPEMFDIAGLIDSVVSTVAPLVEKNKNRLNVVCEDDIGTMCADQTRVRQVLLNLVSNAAKFTEAGTISLVAERRAAHEVLLDINNIQLNDSKQELNSSPSSFVVFEVTDTGIGMSEAQLQRLFEAFVQVDDSTTRRYEGTGLGLAITQRLCRLMGGDIQAQSTPGVGSTFTVYLPSRNE
jgi:signal transduction histidine kinase